MVQRINTPAHRLGGCLLTACLLACLAGSGAASEAQATSDLDSIQQSGVLRILVPATFDGGRYLPRKGSPVSEHQEILERFASSRGLGTELVPIEHFRDMLPALEAGKGDILLANLTVTEARKQRIAFTVPITHVREQLIVRAGEEAIEAVADLEGRTVMVDPSSSFWRTLTKLRTKYPAIKLMERPAHLRDEDELDQLSQGVVDAVVRDSNVADMYLGYRDDIKVAFDIGGIRDIAWGVSRDAPTLLQALNDYLHLENLADQQETHYTDDLDGLKKRKVLRVMLRNNSASYFLYRGELMGFQYEMAKHFAKQHRLRLEVVVPDSHQQMMQWLVQGRADVASGFLVPRKSDRQLGIEFSKPYHRAKPHFIVRNEDALVDLDGLNGRTVVMQPSSGHWEALRQLRQQGYDFTLVAAPEELETEDIIHQVASGEADITVADEHLMDIEIARGVKIRSAFPFAEEQPHSVAVRKGNEKLLAAINTFIKKENKGLLYNILYKKYFQNKRGIRKLARGYEEGLETGQLSPYDDIIRRYADLYGFDWRLVTAQMYQESRFDPAATSFAGARGLLQVMPKTAKQMGFNELEDPDSGIHAGIKYLDWVRDRFDDDLDFADRMWFTLAAYNAGYGHVADARRLAKKKGWDPKRWFDHTEKAMLLLGRKDYARQAKHGYVRGREPVDYVSNIRARFKAYSEMTGSAGLDRDGTPVDALTDLSMLQATGPDYLQAGSDMH
ncbi:MAG: transporter substrate-binding domain-containing protein [Gammaproteobacteria bacterium]